MASGSAVTFFNEVNQRKENFMICVPEPEELNPGRTYFGFLKRILVTLTLRLTRVQFKRVLCRLTRVLFTVA